MSNACPAGGDHTVLHYETVLFGVFDACSKCGVRPNERCPQTPSGHGDHKYSPALAVTEAGIINVGKCDFCGQEIK